ncbi:MAG TPA: alpha/beta fold hydrolase [Burkholderiales bacterium]|nr:alpha/beta fold hydrolase [Burkholderiales bacterium]
MLARVLRRLLAAIALGAVATAWWLGSSWRIGPGAVLLIATALFFAVPATMILLTFAIAWCHRTLPPPELRIGPVAAIRCVLQEILSYTAVYVFLQPFPRLVLPAGRGSLPAARPPVVLVHGYMCNAGGWAWFARRLIARGHAVHAVTLEPLFVRIEDYVEPLARAVNDVVGRGERAILVGHSMGGLVCRAYARRFGGARIARIVTLGTPHHGSALAFMGHGADAFDLRPNAEWLRELAASEEGVPRVPITSIYSCHDNFVAPQDSSVLAGAKNVPLSGLGHLSLLLSRRVAALVWAELER